MTCYLHETQKRTNPLPEYRRNMTAFHCPHAQGCQGGFLVKLVHAVFLLITVLITNGNTSRPLYLFSLKCRFDLRKAQEAKKVSLTTNFLSYCSEDGVTLIAPIRQKLIRARRSKVTTIICFSQRNLTRLTAQTCRFYMQCV